MRLSRHWLDTWVEWGWRKRWWMPKCAIIYMDGRRVECQCGIKLDPDDLEQSRTRRIDNLLDKWNAHRAGMLQNGR